MALASPGPRVAVNYPANSIPVGFPTSRNRAVPSRRDTALASAVFSLVVGGVICLVVGCRQGDRVGVCGLTDRHGVVRRCWGQPVDTGRRIVGIGEGR
jgi:hypothetical protein